MSVVMQQLPGRTFEQLEQANRQFAAKFKLHDLDGIAHAGIAIVTCMDSRIDPLRCLGLQPGDAKIFRNPGGRVTDPALEALVLASHLLGVNRIVVMPHTDCAVAKYDEPTLREKVGAAARKDASWMTFHVVADQHEALRHDVMKVQSHPLIATGTEVAGYLYDVRDGTISRQV